MKSVANDTILPKPRALPATTLDVENTISPIGCNGRPTAIAKPFLIPPYHGFVRLYSYFDHDLPNFYQDGLVTVANGVSARPSTGASIYAQTGGLPAYWSDALRQYVYYDGHNGYDYDLVYQPVYAAAAGRVIFEGWNYPGEPVSGYGQMIMIDHGHGYVTLYGHLSRIQVRSGERVKAGQQIAISGNTGHSSGPHLHFTVFHDCKPTDPYGWTGQGVDPLSSYQGETSAFLWRELPQVMNPIPQWPGLGSEAAPPGKELLDLKLPTTPSLDGLVAAVRRERNALSRQLHRLSIEATYDPSSAAFLLNTGIRPAVAYSLPGVAAVTPDTNTDISTAQLSYDDRLSLVLSSRTPKRHLVGGPWTAFVVRVGGDQFLAGEGPPAQNLEFLIGNRGFQPLMTESNHAGRFVLPIPSGSSHRRIRLITPTARFTMGPPRKPVPVSSTVVTAARAPMRSGKPSPPAVSHLTAGGEASKAPYAPLLLVTLAGGAVCFCEVRRRWRLTHELEHESLSSEDQSE